MSVIQCYTGAVNSLKPIKLGTLKIDIDAYRIIIYFPTKSILLSGLFFQVVRCVKIKNSGFQILKLWYV